MTETETIGGREFRVGATYAARNARSPHQERVFLGYSATGRKGWVDYRPTLPLDGPRTAITRGGWDEWAGEEVKDA